ncbi:M50 family metallopeptidase [Amycolatopsis azurea]|uniref:Peptidase M41 domain-containing protein n=1 Tax=Amycolatopsis azurea DSM 43854 TaxID=1238180 RepID=M2QC63_9PSEU|nr:M50 family metallopeptidase [Amycolatopsis azurea]EMD29630.1 hypothetical protein C791_2989 [Amycolatopsis azurea DSM 43854]OOC07551.1 hypothetical protein B0293_07740 [Amycolatopsis azurea DSM 43854]
MTDRIRACAEHEAGHAVVARALGYHVHTIHVGQDGSGYTAWDYSRAPHDHRAAITAAGDVAARTLGTTPYLDLACDDLARFEADHGLEALWSANRLAERLLTLHKTAVFRLASRLTEHRTLTFP